MASRHQCAAIHLPRWDGHSSFRKMGTGPSGHLSRGTWQVEVSEEDALIPPAHTHRHARAHTHTHTQLWLTIARNLLCIKLL